MSIIYSDRVRSALAYFLRSGFWQTQQVLCPLKVDNKSNHAEA